ncbi:helix-turn-helix domain-containing protein [Nocardia fluminea]|uniref:helix-turn-helix domain-containing protein n=1 Tax=Nocardia fluminea TaxID=134984 RepID=UPI0036552068
MNGEWLTTAEVAQRWKVTTREVQRMASDGTLDHMRVGQKGRRIRIAESVVTAYERAHTHAGTSRR